jgi:ankyrin repeat protein
MKPKVSRLLAAVAGALLAAGCGPSSPRTSLTTAAQSGNYPAVRQHIASHADLNAKDSAGWTPLHLAAMKGDLAMVKLLAEAGADVNRAGPAGKTPVAAAREKGQTSVVQYLEARAAAAPATTAEKTPRGRGLIDGGLGVSDAMNGF